MKSNKLKNIISYSLVMSMIMAYVSIIPASAIENTDSQQWNMMAFQMEGIDSDNDGLSDEYEEIFGTDANDQDSDNDGLNDFLEIKLALNPLSKDSDDDSIEDGYEDSDNDGVSNLDELRYGTDLSKVDTDGDGLNDGEEIHKYNTSSILEDTDGDGILDGDEVILKLDPNSKYSDGTTFDYEKKIEQKLSYKNISPELLEEECLLKPFINGSVAGLLDKKVSVESYDKTMFDNSQFVQGEAIKINFLEDINGKLNLSYDCKEFLDENNEIDFDSLGICKYEDDNFSLINSIKDNETKSLSAQICDEGIYLIIDLKYFLENTGIEDELGICIDEVYSYNASALSDTDFDGIEDSNDSAPKSNSFSGTLKTSLATSRVSYVMDYRNFFKGNSSYNKNISTISSIYSSLAYSGSSLDGLNIKGLMAKHGLKDIKSYELNKSYTDADVSQAYIGHRAVNYNGTTKEIIAVIVRGTNGTIQEWESNFDIGSTSLKSKYSDWKISTNHKGFDVASTRILKCLTQYENAGYLNKSAKKTYWVTGHSRGAAIANIMAARLIDSSKEVYSYTFASPNTTTSSTAGNYTGIYNIINKDDFVPYLPMSGWGFKHYGKSYIVSIASNYETEWEKLTGIRDYNPDTLGMDNTIKALTAIMKARNDAYIFTCKCHGNGSSDNITIRNYGTSKNSREAAIAKIPSNALSYCAIKRYDGGAVSGWDFTVCQKPEYFMQVLASFMAGDINAYRFAVELNIADRYESAKTAIIRSGIGGLEHPHYPESYYLLSKHVS